MDLRPYQHKAVADIRAAYADGAQSPVFILPTGSGKSVVLRHVAEQAKARGRRVMAIAHRRELVSQLAGRHLAHLSPGVIQAGVEPSPHAPVQVASVQTLARRLATVQPPDLLLFDEAHHAPAGQWKAVRAAFPNAKVLGVTATPCRLDGRGLRDCFDALVLGPSAAWLTENGYLAPAEVWAPSAPDLTGIRTRAGDWAPGELAAALEKSQVVGDAVQSYRRHLDGRTAVAFCASVAHAEGTASAFRAAGVSAEVLTGETPDRDDVLSRLASGETQVLASVDVISEGFDLPAVAGAILLRPTKSLGLYLQQVGRALRPAEGKSAAVILDHAGNALRHGLPDEDRQWSLDGAPPRPDTQRTEDGQVLSVRQCPACFAVHRPAPACPFCSLEHEPDGRIPASVAGELRRLEREEAERAREEEKRARAAQRKRLGMGFQQRVAMLRKKGVNDPRALAAEQLRDRRARAIRDGDEEAERFAAGELRAAGLRLDG